MAKKIKSKPAKAKAPAPVAVADEQHPDTDEKAKCTALEVGHAACRCPECQEGRRAP